MWPLYNMTAGAHDARKVTFKRAIGLSLPRRPRDSQKAWFLLAAAANAAGTSMCLASGGRGCANRLAVAQEASAVKRFLFLGLLFLSGLAQAAGKPGIEWQKWSDDVFDRAAREHRYVLLDLEAVWCHWCHVMDEVTYSDRKVIELIRQHYIAGRVDQDSRPDISRRYENWGWPATVVFNAQGGEIMKRRGFIQPPMMIAVLEEIIVDPSPIKYRDSEPVAAFAERGVLGDTERAALERGFRETHDAKLGGMQQDHKFIDVPTAEYGMLLASRGETDVARMTERTLTGALALLDPAWGGAYQYSTDGDWQHPHFEKIMAVQADYLRVYALAWRQFGETRYRDAASAIHRYVNTFLRSPEGSYYTSQDADLVQGEHSAEFFALDDAARRKLGIPAIDKHRYARENGWLIEALATAYTATGERGYLDDALAATKWIEANRALGAGGFRHDEVDAAGPYLEDTLAMGRAYIALYVATAERSWLARAQSSAAFIEKHFKGPSPGYLTAAPRAGERLAPLATLDENVSLARFANLLRRYTGAETY